MNNTADIRRAAEKVAADAIERISELAELEDRKKAEIADIKAEIAELRALARRYSPAVEANTQPKSNGRSKRYKVYAGREVTGQVADVIGTHFADKSFTVVDVAEHLPLHPSTVRHAIYLLRDQEALRAAERRRVGNGRIPSQFFRVMDHETLEEAANR